MTCRFAYMLYDIGHFDIFTMFTTKWKLSLKVPTTRKLLLHNKKEYLKL